VPPDSGDPFTLQGLVLDSACMAARAFLLVDTFRLLSERGVASQALNETLPATERAG